MQSLRAISTGGGGNKQARELKQQVSDIEHKVHSQLEQTPQTRVRMQGIANNAINKLHEEGLSNAINSTTVVAVLIATVVPQRLRPRCRSVAGLQACHGRCAHPGEQPRHHAAQLLGSLLRCLPDHQEQEEEIAVILLFLVFLFFHDFVRTFFPLRFLLFSSNSDMELNL